MPINKHKELPMMQLSFAVSGVMSAFYPAESELSKRVRRLIRSVRKQLGRYAKPNNHQSSKVNCSTKQGCYRSFSW